MTKVPKPKSVISVLRAALQKSPFETLETLASEYGKAEAGFTERKHYCLIGGYEFAQHVSRDRLLMGEFLEMPPASELRSPNPANVLRYTMMAIVGACGARGLLYERARVYAKALQPFFDAGAPSSVALEALRENGIHFLYDAATAEFNLSNEAEDAHPTDFSKGTDLKADDAHPTYNTANSAMSQDATGSERLDYEQGDGGSVGEGKGEREAEGEGEGEGEMEALRIALMAFDNRTVFTPYVLHVNVSRRLMSEVLHLRTDRPATLTIKVQATEGGFVRVVATDLS